MDRGLLRVDVEPDDAEEGLRDALMATLGVLDAGPQAAFDGLVLGAAAATGCPVAALVFPARRGADDGAVPLEPGSGPGPADADDREATRRSGLKAAHPDRRAAADLVAWLREMDALKLEDWRSPDRMGRAPAFLAREPLRAEQRTLGWLCVAHLDPRPSLSAPERRALRGLADAAEALLAQRRPGVEADAQALRRRQGLLTRAGHEMRTPLNAVLGFAQLLQMEPGLIQGRAGAWVDQIDRSARHLLGLVEEMLALARLESGRHRPWPMPLDLGALLDEGVAELQALAGRHRVRLTRQEGTERRSGAPGPRVMADGRLLRQVVSALVAHAIEHSPPGQAVDVQVEEASSDTGRVRVAIVARGDGVAPHDLALLFRPFERPQSGDAGVAAEPAPGTDPAAPAASPPEGRRPADAGLARVRQLAESMNVRVDVHLGPGPSHAFTIDLPAALG